MHTVLLLKKYFNFKQPQLNNSFYRLPINK